MSNLHCQFPCGERMEPWDSDWKTSCKKCGKTYSVDYNKNWWHEGLVCDRDARRYVPGKNPKGLFCMIDTLKENDPEAYYRERLEICTKLLEDSLENSKRCHENLINAVGDFIKYIDNSKGKDGYQNPK